MTEINIHKNGGSQKELAAPTRAWEPFQLMRSLLRWDPFAEMSPVPIGEAAFSPAFDVKETKDGFIFKADLPGIEEKDLDVKITKNRLSVSGKREHEKTEKGDTYYTYERSYGSFTRAFTLPDGVDADAIKAELKAGVLTINMPKKPEAQPKKVAVKAG